MMKFTKLKKIALIGLSLGVVATVVPVVATSCSAASTQPNVAASISFSLGGNSFSISNGIKFSGDKGINVEGKTYSQSPGYVLKVDGNGEGQDPEASKKNKASNSFVALGYAIGILDIVKKIDNILPGLANIGKLQEVAGSKTTVIDVANRLNGYQGHGPGVERYGLKEIKLDCANISDASIWTKKYKDPATDKDEPADQVVASFNVTLVYDYWKTTNGSNVVWQNKNVAEVKLNPMKISFKPERFEEEKKWYFKGVYSIVNENEKNKIEIGGLDLAKTNELINNIAKINQVIRGDIVNQNLSSYFDKNKGQFELIFNIFQ